MLFTFLLYPIVKFVYDKFFDFRFGEDEKAISKFVSKCNHDLSGGKALLNAVKSMFYFFNKIKKFESTAAESLFHYKLTIPYEIKHGIHGFTYEINAKYVNLCTCLSSGAI